MEKSFIMIRPDGGQVLSGIDDIICKEGFDITDVYSVPVWDELYIALHEKELNNANDPVSDNIKLNIWMSKTIFGNCGLILLLKHDKYYNFNDLLSKTYDLKFKIRDRFTNTRDGKFVIAINASLLDLDLKYLNRNGNLVVTSNDDPTIFSIMMQEKGNYLPAYFNYIHCPDNSIDEITKEYDIMEKRKILTMSNKLTSYEYDACKKMHSCYRI